MAALQHCNASFTALCVSDRRSSLVLASDAIAGNMAHIAQLTNLTKLHLGLCDLQQAADFQQLTQLTKLQDLGLQSYRASASCEAILFSNRHCLRKVNLAARSWTVATYRALQQLPCLQALVIRLRSFSVTQARTLAGIRANHFTLDVRDVRRIQDDALLAVSTVAPMVQIQELMLWDMDSVSCRDLRALPFLKTLTVVNSPLLTGTCFCVHANVTELNFVNCPRVSENGLRHMLSAAFPKLKSLNFQRSSNQFGNHGDFDAAALQVLSCGVNLEVIDLRGLTGLTHQGVDKLKRAIEEEQNEGRAEPLVTLHLPVGSTQIGQGQPFGVVYDSLYIPPFCVVGEQGSALIVCKRDSHEKLVWGVGSVVFSACLFIYELQVMAKKDKEQDEATVSFGFV